jgi:suppressor of ftsI
MGLPSRNSIFCSLALFTSVTASAQNDPHAGHLMAPVSKSSSEAYDPLVADFKSLPDLKKPEVIVLSATETYELKATIVKQTVGGETFRRFAYNGSIPGPLFKIKQGQTAKIKFINETDVETSVHSHGLRHSWKMDGQVPRSQPAVKPGESFVYELKFPDAGVFWYHPHVREDYQQDMGLMGNFWVEPQNGSHWNEVNREDTIMVDDMLAKSPVAYPRVGANHAIMGRFGDTLLANGLEKPEWNYQPGEVVRYFITNAANTRTFRLRFNGAKMKLVGSDLSAFEQELFVDTVSIAPGERYIVEVQFPKTGAVTFENAPPDSTTTMIDLLPKGNAVEKSLSSVFDKLRTNAEMTREMKSAALGTKGQKRYKLSIEVDMGSQKMDHSQMNMSGMDHSKMGHGAGTAQMKNADANKDVPWAPVPSKIEWQDGMKMMNEMSTTSEIKWKLKDQAGKENMNVNWQLKLGKSVRIKIQNPSAGMHPMQHPIHFHGQRFYVEKVNGKTVQNRAWKDTVLVGQGDTVEIVLEASNPGKWMVHCHIAEHLTSGMMTNFDVN